MTTGALLERAFLCVPLVGLAVLVTACVTEDTWTGHVYPSKDKLSVSRMIGVYSSLQECRDAATGVIAFEGWINADYECGLNCEKLFKEIPDSVLVCKQTSR